MQENPVSLVSLFEATARVLPRDDDDLSVRENQNGGRGGIRTHGGLPHARFRVECLKPDSATLPFFAKRRCSGADYQLRGRYCKLRPRTTAARRGRNRLQIRY